MAKKWRAVQAAPTQCFVHDKSVHTSESSARAAAAEVERREGLERGAMDAYWCAEAKGWHIGHKSIRARLERTD